MKIFFLSDEVPNIGDRVLVNSYYTAKGYSSGVWIEAEYTSAMWINNRLNFRTMTHTNDMWCKLPTMETK